MKKAFLIITLIAGFGAATFAQDKAKTPEQRADHLTKALQKRLNLTADQAGKVHTIMFERATRVDSLKLNGAGGDKKMNRMVRRDIKYTTDQKLTAVLNADQLKAFKDWKATHKNKHGNKPAAQTDVKQG
ncbi:hypothetical protein [Mucilaginibacter ginkgonis]|uniref:LTXXQ motif family protein n=1 Tax=Mucilaginibacter ginkgonis TaxID=2682091 RepID=A0A6I4HTT2_9SPHI|nr:hypothetical protein [Mucilaginibacter ginkgonis]QQL50382.1 hypothetical protein GO620_002690 [Mucilaginibacter ginkgonis]